MTIALCRILSKNLGCGARVCVAFLCLFCVIAMHIRVDAQNFTVQYTERPLRALTGADGLSDQLVNVIYKDSEGYVWFGTGVGADRFDGNNMVNYHFLARDGMSRRVTSIAELPDGRILVGASDGLYEATPDGSLAPLAGDKIRVRVLAMAYDHSSKLYVGSERGLFVYDLITNKIEHKLIHSDVLDGGNEVTAMAFASGSALWLTTPGALHRYSIGDGSIATMRLPDDAGVRSIIDLGDKLYLGTYGSGVMVYTAATKSFAKLPAVGNNLVTAMNVDPARPQAMLVATDGEGIFCIDYDGVHPAFDERHLRSRSVYSMLIDERGLMWIGYYQNGVDYTPFYDNVFETYSPPGIVDTHGKAVRALYVNGSRKLIGTREGLYYIDDENGTSMLFHTPQLRSNIIFCITPVDDRFYIGTYGGGMYVFDPRTMSIADFDSAHRQPFVEGTVFAITVDSEGDVWMGTSDGVYRYSGGLLKAHFTSDNSQLPAGNVYEIFFDSAGRGWICTENGMAVWDGHKLQGDRFPAGFANNMKIRDICESRGGNLYFIPDRGRIFCSNLSLTDYGYVDTELGFVSAATFMIEDDEERKWIGSEKGLACIEKDGACHYYTNADGLPDMVFTLCPPMMDEDGNIWMGNNSGLVRMDCRRLHKRLDDTRTLPQFTDIYIDGMAASGLMQQSAAGKSLRMDSRAGSITVSWSDFSYTDPRFKFIEYRLDGVDDGWRLAGGGTPITYFTIPDGRSTLHVRFPGDNQSERILAIDHSVRFNWTVWALIAVTLILVSMTLAYIYWRQMHMRTVEILRAEKDSMVMSVEKAEEEKRLNRYRTTRLSDQECRRLIKVLDSVMKKEKPYLKTDLKSSDLAAIAGCTGHDLSYLFNQFMNISFYDYVNRYRVEEFKSMVRNVDTSRFTLSAMAQQCGFSSRASFFRHFKAITGQTPAEYMNEK